MKPNIPSPRFQENDVDRIIATFGAKPKEGTKEKLETLLRDQKEQFLSNEKQRGTRSREDSGRTI